MLYVYGGIAVDPARKDEVRAEAAAFAQECRREQGCIEYNLAWNAEDEDYLRLLEIWDTTEDYTAHSGQEHVSAWTTFISSAATAAPQFTKYLVDVVES